jgi:hypothetical protein
MHRNCCQSIPGEIQDDWFLVHFLNGPEFCSLTSSSVKNLILKLTDINMKIVFSAILQDLVPPERHWCENYFGGYLSWDAHEFWDILSFFPETVDKWLQVNLYLSDICKFLDPPGEMMKRCHCRDITFWKQGRSYGEWGVGIGQEDIQQNRTKSIPSSRVLFCSLQCI